MPIYISMLKRFNHLQPHLLLIAVILLLIPQIATANNSHLVKTSLCDIRVAYFFEDEQQIDWPTLYYLNDQFGCRIDLIKFYERSKTEIETATIDRAEIYLNRLYFPQQDPLAIKDALNRLFVDRYPDIVILDNPDKNPTLKAAFDYLATLKLDPDHIFKIEKMYRRNYKSDLDNPNAQFISINSQEMLNNYRDRMKSEIPIIFPYYRLPTQISNPVMKYEKIKSLSSKTNDANFITGLATTRLTEIIDDRVESGPMKSTLEKQAKGFIASFRKALATQGKEQVDNVVNGFRELRFLGGHQRVIEADRYYQYYLYDLIRKAEICALDMVGLEWEGSIAVDETPHGPALKFTAVVSAAGPKEINLNGIRFHPFWDTATVALLNQPLPIKPHQNFVREFYIDIDRKYLESENSDSLRFSIEITYGQIPLVFTSSVPVWEAPELRVDLEPDFYFIKPFPKLDIDKVVSSVNLKLVVTKPPEYQGTVTIEFSPPRGMFAGVYTKEMKLEKGDITETLRVPFTISNLFELGTQTMSVDLLSGGHVIASDTGLIRVAACEVPDTRQIGFMPDTLGQLEDILRMIEADFRPLTDRSLITGDLDAYDVILIGSGSYRDYPSLTRISDRIENYIRGGGSVIVFGQPEDWPSGVVPFSLQPTVEAVDKDHITNRIPGANVLSRPYPISENNLLSHFFKRREVTPAVVAPSERVFVTPSGATLLSVSRLGDGQMIYCGLPLMEMIQKLDIDAIHLFANLMNY